MDPWLATVRGRLGAEGFTLLDNVAADGRTFPLVARRSGFELTKFGFAENFFIFGEFDRLDTGTLRDFSASAFRCAKQHKAIPLPCGLFEGVFCYSVAIGKSVDEAALAAVRSETPPKHWAAAEIPVVYDSSRGALAYFEKTPMWGGAYFAGFRKKIQKMLG